MGFDYELVDVEAFLSDFEEDVWYACDEDEDTEFGEECGFVYEDCVDGETVFVVCDEDDPEAE